MRRAILIAATLAMALTMFGATTAFAWTEYYDGSVLPTFVDPWWEDNNGGGSSVGGGMITMSAPTDGWYDIGIWTDSPALATMVVGARLKVNSMGGSGLSLLLASTGAAQPSTPLGLGILGNGNFALVDYSGGPEAGQNNPIVLQDLGAADNGWHTAYLLSAPDGDWQANIDGTLYSGTMGGNDWGEAVGYAEFAANTYWMNTRAVNVSFDWLGYGDGGSMVVPEPSSLLALGAMGLGALGFIKRRRA